MARRRRKKRSVRILIPLLSLLIFSVFIVTYLLPEVTGKSSRSAFRTTKDLDMPTINQQLLTPNEYSRPQTPLKKVKGIVVHYVGNPGTSAEANRNYFNGLATSKQTYASSHFIVDLDGSIIQCIPLDEIAYASNKRNEDTISIEVCHPDETGEFTQDSYNSLVHLVAWLSTKYNLTPDQIIRHYDVTGKLCPLYYVTNEDKWQTFKSDITQLLH